MPDPAERPGLRLLPEDGGLADLIDANAEREPQIVAEWRTLLADRGAGEALPDRAFDELYVPGLHTAHGQLRRNELAAFAASAREWGRQLAALGVSFASYVADLRLLKEAYARAFSDQPGLVPTLLARVDTVHAALLGLVAESYYRARGAALPEPIDPDDLEVPGMVGVSPAMRAVFARLGRAAVEDGPVLLCGETGTGKELAARGLHVLGPRRRGPFVAVNCAALPRELVESELFGHRRGAFSGAAGEHPGLFRSASGGTLLLDEITEMAPELQAKLLRVLQERTVRPLGGLTEVAVDVRVVATTNREPDAAIAAGLLRADLYYRLAANRIVLPPLRTRPDDVMPLVVHWRQQRVERRLAAPGVTADAIARLRAEPWPGNVRELWNALDEAAGIAPDVIDVVALGGEPPPAGAAATPGDASDVPSLADAERALIARALERTGGNKRQAAQLLGISRTQLYAKIDKYGLAR